MQLWDVRFKHPMLIDDRITISHEKVTLTNAASLVQKEYQKQNIFLDNVNEIKVNWVVPHYHKKS